MEPDNAFNSVVLFADVQMKTDKAFSSVLLFAEQWQGQTMLLFAGQESCSKGRKVANR